MKRREVVIGCGTFLAGTVAGVSLDRAGQVGLTEGSTPTPTPTPAETPTETPTDTPTAAPTETPTDTPTAAPTDTPTPSSAITHELGEQFTVGEGSNAVTYRVIEFYRADELGDMTSTVTAEDAYLVVVVELTNLQGDIITLPQEFRVLSRELKKWFKFDQPGSEHVDNDGRLGEAAIVTQGIHGGESTRGAVAFDVPLDASYRVMIVPTDERSEPEHHVPIGELSSVPEL
jgi:hypothetical protein